MPLNRWSSIKFRYHRALGPSVRSPSTTAQETSAAGSGRKMHMDRRVVLISVLWSGAAISGWECDPSTYGCWVLQEGLHWTCISGAPAATCLAWRLDEGGSGTTTTPAESGTSCRKRQCSDFASCDTVRAYVKRCPNNALDHDKDGTPCEKLCGKR